MTRFLAAAVGPARKVLSLVFAALLICGAVYLGNRSLARDGYLTAGGNCTAHWENYPEPPFGNGYGRCPYGEQAWPFPTALLLGLLGLRIAFVVVRQLRWRRPRLRRAGTTDSPGFVTLNWFVLSRAGSFARRILAIVIAYLAIAEAVSLASHRQSGDLMRTLPVITYRWSYLAVLLLVGGLASALVIAGRRRPPRRLPDGVSQDRLGRI